ncbi:HAD-IA family hydrolase [Shewanella sp. SP2S2-4]|uniref:HAD family hydrolase n=1 Tax=Shewanella sp. SP2S2-4 TaxID=3063539 RepID=UPI00288DD50F|nr:HAD-IA family hydrolase [Shewanella sp. SP2S2-4]MDT3274134.1 HAD-IA family hydrolase [Shewanella sp. SP2S2-4]
MSIQLVIFDLDGTLVDSAREVTQVINEMRRVRDLKPLNQDSLLQEMGHGADRILSLALPQSIEPVTCLVAEFRDRYKLISTPKSSLYPNVEATLKFLKKIGFKLAVCTNKPSALCDKVLLETEIAEYFDVVISGRPDHIAKPNAEPVLRVLQQLGLEPASALLVGDTTIDQKAAKAANVPFIFFSSGYDDGVARGDIYFDINDMSQLLAMRPFSFKTISCI